MSDHLLESSGEWVVVQGVGHALTVLERPSSPIGITPVLGGQLRRFGDGGAVTLPPLFPEELGLVPSGWFACTAEEPDMDRALDLALDRALFAWGDHAVPDVDPSRLTIVGDGVLTLSQAIRQVHRASTGADTESLWAHPYWTARAFKRLPIRVRIQELSPTLPPVGPVMVPEQDLALIAQGALDDAARAKSLDGAFTLDRLDVVRRVVRSRAFAERVMGKSKKCFAVVIGDLSSARIISVHDKQAEARAAALTLAKADSRDSADWSVVALVGRPQEDGSGLLPMLNVRRRPRTQRGSLKVIGVSVKDNPGKPAGWVFGSGHR